MTRAEFSGFRNDSISGYHREFDLSNAAITGGKKAFERDSDRVYNAKLKAYREVETDQESTGSSEDMESPRSVVVKVRKWPAINKNVNLHVHSQILRIREEDSHIGEDVAESLICKDTDDDRAYHRVDVFICSHRSILPASPLKPLH